MHRRDAGVTAEGFYFDSNVGRSLLSHTQTRNKSTIFLRYSGEALINKERDALFTISLFQDFGDCT